MVEKQPKGTNGIENKDWCWKFCEDCQGTGKKQRKRTVFDKKAPEEKECPKCKGNGRKKKSLWKMFDYFFEQQFEPLSDESIKDLERRKNKRFLTGEKGGKTADNVYKLKGRTRKDFYDLKHGRNKRCVWKIKTSTHMEKHFATFPEELAELMIRAGCPTEVCKKCGLPRIKVVERNISYNKDEYAKCECGAKFRKGLLVDPFMGIGTSLKEAYRQQKDFIGFDISEKYYNITKSGIKDSMAVQRIDNWLTKK